MAGRKIIDSEDLDMNNDRTYAVGSRNMKTSVIMKIIFGSILGIFIFMTPMPWQGELTIPLWIIKNLLADVLGALQVYILLAVICIAAVGSTLLTIMSKKEFPPFVQILFRVSPLMLVVRWFAVIAYVISIFKLGPEAFWEPNTGGLIAFELMPAMMCLFFAASVLLPLLTEYGLMEILGWLLRPIFRPLFHMPGHSSVLALSSWFGSGTVGMLTADEEYKKGRYTGREAAILCFGFCTIPLPSIFAYTTAIGGLDSKYFMYFFLCCTVVAIVSTAVMCRIPPLSMVSNEKSPEAASLVEERKETFRESFQKAYDRAEKAPGLLEMLKEGSITCIRLYIDVFPLVILLATIVLVIAEHTTAFDIISKPFIPILNLIHMPEASLVAPAMFVGFADLLLPFLSATSVTSQLAKFVICVVGTMQVICMSETGAVMIKTSIPVKFWTVLFVFLEKTVIAMMIALAMGRLIGLT
jgi:nucleoside recognition membrane protein YjiH